MKRWPRVPTYQIDWWGWSLHQIDRLRDWVTQDEINLILGGNAVAHLGPAGAARADVHERAPRCVGHPLGGIGAEAGQELTIRCRRPHNTRGCFAGRGRRRGMISYLTRRVAQAILVVLMASFLVFGIMHWLPGDPILIYVTSDSLQAVHGGGDRGTAG